MKNNDLINNIQFSLRILIFQVKKTDNHENFQFLLFLFFLFVWKNERSILAYLFCAIAISLSFSSWYEYIAEIQWIFSLFII